MPVYPVASASSPRKHVQTRTRRRGYTCTAVVTRGLFVSLLACPFGHEGAHRYARRHSHSSPTSAAPPLNPRCLGRTVLLSNTGHASGGLFSAFVDPNFVCRAKSKDQRPSSLPARKGVWATVAVYQRCCRGVAAVPLFLFYCYHCLPGLLLSLRMAIHPLLPLEGTHVGMGGGAGHCLRERRSCVCVPLMSGCTALDMPLPLSSYLRPPAAHRCCIWWRG